VFKSKEEHRFTNKMLHAGIEALFGRNRDGHRTKHIFHLRRRHHTQKDEHDELAKYFLDKPRLDKTLIHGSTFTFAAVQGWRSSMEDTHKHLIPFDNQSWKLWSYFSIFDGHNGKKKQQLIKQNIFLKVSIPQKLHPINLIFIY
jgi:hypothetical protein